MADENTPIPGGTGTFTSVRYPWLDGGRILFAGEGADGQQGIYLWDGESISVVVDRQTLIPEGDGTFTDFAFNWSQPSICGDAVAFRGTGGNDQEGIYLERDGLLVKVIDRSDTLEGKSIKELVMGHQSLTEDTLAFRVRFTDDTVAIVLATATRFRRGDADADGRISLGDVVLVLYAVFLETHTSPCLKSLDADDDGNIRIGDVIQLLILIFRRNLSLREPFPGCGADPTSDLLGCDSFPPCAE